MTSDSRLTQNAEYVLTETLTPGAGRFIGRPTRVWVRSQKVQVLGPVNFEPSMVRVKCEDGTVRRVFKADLTRNDSSEAQS